MIFSKIYLPCFLFFLWIFLNASISNGQIFLGLLLSIWLYFISLKLDFNSKPKKLYLLPILVIRVLNDVFKSSIVLSYSIISFNISSHSQKFISIPIKIRDPYALAFLTCIISYIPGTIWVNISNSYILTLHVLNFDNEKDLIDLIKTKYELPLMEIFE
ncbi:MAG: monovalent cation/H+ antiporter subunit E [Bordetella sp.]|nr:MAG: monovalent cation/H+ antiporter subunit E [Bordetella sp.]